MTEDVLWTVDEIAGYLHRSRSTVQDQYVNREDFPSPVRLPSAKGRSHRLWFARQVVEWARSFQGV